MSDKPADKERRRHPAASTLSDEKEDILSLIDQLPDDVVFKGKLKRKFVAFAESAANRFSILARFYEEAQRDVLTGLPRREDLCWNIIERLEVEFLDNTFAVIYFDAKQFKRINDEISHGVGDEVIQRIAHVLSTEMRGQDFKARLSGDEFGGAIFLDVGDQSGTKNHQELILQIVERCCVQFEQTPWTQKYKEWAAVLAKRPGVATINPTLNAGVVIVQAGQGPRIKPGSGKSMFKAILKMAEELMYKSKRYEKSYGHRRTFYKVVEFENQKLKIMAHKHYGVPPTVSS